jgi:microcystin-dependent protein
VDQIPIGAIVAWAGPKENVPSNYLVCDGSYLKTADYGALFKAISYSWGGNGSTFYLPDLMGRFLRGVTRKLAEIRIAPRASLAVLAEIQGTRWDRFKTTPSSGINIKTLATRMWIPAIRTRILATAMSIGAIHIRIKAIFIKLASKGRAPTEVGTLQQFVSTLETPSSPPILDKQTFRRRPRISCRGTPRLARDIRKLPMHRRAWVILSELMSRPNPDQRTHTSIG